MASSESRPLTYRLTPIFTAEASCERLARPNNETSSGSFHSEIKFTTTQVAGSDDKVCASLRLTVTGIPKEHQEPVFRATCRVDTEVQFRRAQSDDLPLNIASHLGNVLFQVGAERCRTLISNMGYPGHSLGTHFPGFEKKSASRPPPEPLSDATPQPKSRKRGKGLTRSA